MRDARGVHDRDEGDRQSGHELRAVRGGEHPDARARGECERQQVVRAAGSQCGCVRRDDEARTEQQGRGRPVARVRAGDGAGASFQLPDAHDYGGGDSNDCEDRDGDPYRLARIPAGQRVVRSSEEGDHSAQMSRVPSEAGQRSALQHEADHAVTEAAHQHVRRRGGGDRDREGQRGLRRDGGPAHPAREKRRRDREGRDSRHPEQSVRGRGHPGQQPDCCRHGQPGRAPTWSAEEDEVGAEHGGAEGRQHVEDDGQLRSERVRPDNESGCRSRHSGPGPGDSSRRPAEQGDAGNRERVAGGFPQLAVPRQVPGCKQQPQHRPGRVMRDEDGAVPAQALREHERRRDVRVPVEPVDHARRDRRDGEHVRRRGGHRQPPQCAGRHALIAARAARRLRAARTPVPPAARSAGPRTARAR